MMAATFAVKPGDTLTLQYPLTMFLDSRYAILRCMARTASSGPLPAARIRGPSRSVPPMKEAETI